MSSAALISVLARSLLAGEPTEAAVHARSVNTLGQPWRWLRPLARRYAEAFSGGTRPRHRDVVRFLLDDRGLAQALAKHDGQIRIAQWLTGPERMQPAEAARHWDLPAIESAGELAEQLSLTPGELDWFADLKGLGYKFPESKLQHYCYRILPKRSGGLRLTERPKSRLKSLQRRILDGILDRIPVHRAVHGFVKDRSIVTFAAPHVGRDALLRLDLQDFFPTFPAARIHALFRTLGYPESVAGPLTGICTNAVPRYVWARRPPEIGVGEWREARTLYARPHLPQGAPTSPALANLATYHLDCRLSGLAKSAGAVYTRYADDLAFSGGEEFARAVERFSAHAASIALEEGFSVNHHKTRVMRPGVRQQLAGIVVNRKLSIPRREIDLLEAILTNCVRSGPHSQNRASHPDFRSHLEGRIGLVAMVDSAKAQRLRRLFDAIEW